LPSIYNYNIDRKGKDGKAARPLYFISGKAASIWRVDAMKNSWK